MTTSTEKPAAPQAVKGLKGVIAGDSAICLVDGQAGVLLYRGYHIDDLAEGGSTYEEVAYLLLKGELPSKSQLAEFGKELGSYSQLPKEVIDFLRTLPRDVLPMTALRCAVSLLGVYDPEAEDMSVESNLKKSLELTARVATIVAAVRRLRDGNEPVEPRPELGFSGNFMWMLNGKVPSADETRAMDLILILHAEHGFNASTFSGRVIVATLTDMYSAITGAIGALKGPLHGGANTEVLKTLIEIGSVDKVASWVEQTRERKGKFMGFGHAVYQTRDPRAKHLKELSRRLGIEKNDTRWYDISIEMEDQITPLINKHCNVDFYSASLQHYMDIPGDLFTCIFAASRISGWCAHVLEQLSDNKIIRPSSNYVGPEQRPYVNLEARG